MGTTFLARHHHTQNFTRCARLFIPWRDYHDNESRHLVSFFFIYIYVEDDKFSSFFLGEYSSSYIEGLVEQFTKGTIHTHTERGEELDGIWRSLQIALPGPCTLYTWGEVTWV
jgi:hypothetical protein